MTLQRLNTIQNASPSDQEAWFWRAFKAAQTAQRRRRLFRSRGDKGDTGPFVPTYAINDGGGGGGGVPIPLTPAPLVPNYPPTAANIPGGSGVLERYAPQSPESSTRKIPWYDFPPYNYKKIPGKKRPLRPLILMKNAPKGTPTMLPMGSPLPPGVMAPVWFSAWPWNQGGGGGGGGSVASW